MTPEKAEAPQGGFARERSGGGSVADYSRNRRKLATVEGGKDGSQPAAALPPASAAAAAGAAAAVVVPAPMVLGRHVVKPCHSNSTVSGEFCHSSGLWACLDRLTIVCRVRQPDIDKFGRWVAQSNHLSVLQHSQGKGGFRQQAKFADVGLMQVGDRASGAGVSSGLKLRFDFNPQKVPAEALAELAEFVYADSVHFTRVDVAIDYMQDLGKCSAIHKRLKRNAVYGAAGDCTGWTFGSRRGARYTRIYDKRREREEQGYEDDALLLEVGDAPLWRCEAESRNSTEPLPLGLFDGLRLMHSTAEFVDWRDRLVIRQLLADPNALHSVPQGKTRDRYWELVKECTEEISPSPADIYAQMRPVLLDDIELIKRLIAGGEVLDDAPSIELEMAAAAQAQAQQEALEL